MEELDQAVAFVERSDPEKRWAWRVTFKGGREESGTMPDWVYDPGEALEALEGVVHAMGGDWDSGAAEPVSAEGSHWLWRSNESYRQRDPLSFATDRGLQMTTLLAGWHFYVRKEGEDAQQALTQWIDGVKAVLELGADPSALARKFRRHLQIALEDASSEELKRDIRAIAAG